MFAYQWRRCGAAGANCRAIADGTNRTYQVAPEDASKTFRVTVIARNVAGSSKASSRPTSVVPAQANLWIDANGGSCTRASTPREYRDGAACATADAAHRAAAASPDASLVLVKAGSYGTFSVAVNRTSPNGIVFAPEPFGKVIVDGISVDGADYVTFRDFEMSYVGPDHQRGVFAGQGSSFVTFERIDAGSVSMWFAQNVTVLGGDYGPCRAPANGCDLTRIDVSDNVVIDGALFHDYNYTPACVQSADCHWRALYANGVHGFTLRNSTFRNSVFAPWTTISGPDAQARGNQDVLIENNEFGRPVQSPSRAGWQFAWCESGSQPAYRNITIRFNSFARDTELTVPGELPCRVSNFKVYGNIFGARAPCPTNQVSVQWSYNVYAGSVGGTCGPGDVNIGGTTMPFYAVDTTAPGPGDYRLVGRRRAPDNRVPMSAGCPPRDKRGVRRGHDRFCDAGAFER